MTIQEQVKEFSTLSEHAKTLYFIILLHTTTIPEEQHNFAIGIATHWDTFVNK